MLHQNRLVLWLLPVLCGAVVAWPAPASDWPRFRGPNGTGVSADQDIPVRWNEKDGVLWKAAVPGLGNSSPVVWGNRIFLQSATEDGKERMLLCLDVVDGRVLWSRKEPGGKAKINRKNSLASSTPATDGERVYALFWDGKEESLHAYDLDGKPVWSHKLGGFASQHGAGASPIVYSGRVFLAHDQDRASAVVALDAKTGKPAWQTPRRAFNACYSTPFVLEKPGSSPELIVGSTAGVTSYDPQTGKENWDFQWTFPGEVLRTVASPVYGDGVVVMTSGNGAGSRHVVAVKAEGKGDVSRTNLSWQTTKALPYVPCLLARGEHFYFVNDGGIAGCVVAKTGEQVWSERLGGNVSSSPVLIDGKVYTISEDGQVYVFAAGPKYELLARSNVGEPVSATPAVANGRLYIRGQKHLFCIGKPAANGG